MKKSNGHFQNAIQRLFKKKIAVFCILMLSLIYFGGIFASIISPYDYTSQDYTNIKKPPSIEHIMGTDRAGRDVFTRVLWGIQNTAIITFVALIILADTFKNSIKLLIPGFDLILNSLYETLKDITLFIKDLLN